MVNTWFTSDFHFGHRNIIQYCNRPFASTGEMDAAILANLNRQVGDNDQLYFLGDFSVLAERKKQGSTVIASCAGTFTS
jgi:calcineurin-like phosphoesterase family protein